MQHKSKDYGEGWCYKVVEGQRNGINLGHGRTLAKTEYVV